jgi:hypothetical protein
MYNFDYIPLDQKVIAENVRELEKRRKAMMIDCEGHLTKTAKEAFAEAFIAGNAREIIIFPHAYENAHKFRRITGLLDSIGLAWHDLDEDLYVVRKWFYEAIADRSERALTELKSLIG